MKKYLLVLISFFFLVNNAQAKLNIFACESEWAKLVEEIAKDRAKIRLAVHPKQDAHHLHAKPSLIAKARNADLLVCNGADLEIGWLPIIVQNARNDKIRPGNHGYFLAADYVKPIEIPHELDRKHGDIHVWGNPHLHLDPRNLFPIAKALTERLKTIDPGYASFYEENYKKFTQRLTTNIAKWQKQSTKLKGQKIVVIHKRYSYLVNWLKLNRVATLEKLPGVSPSLKYLKEVEEALGQHSNTLALVAPFDNTSYVNWLNDNSNAKIIDLPYSPEDNQDLIAFYTEIIDKLSQ